MGQEQLTGIIVLLTLTVAISCWFSLKAFLKVGAVSVAVTGTTLVIFYDSGDYIEVISTFTFIPIAAGALIFGASILTRKIYRKSNETRLMRAETENQQKALEEVERQDSIFLEEEEERKKESLEKKASRKINDDLLSIRENIRILESDKTKVVPKNEIDRVLSEMLSSSYIARSKLTSEESKDDINHVFDLYEDSNVGDKSLDRQFSILKSRLM